MARPVRCDICGATKNVGSWRIAGPVSTVDVDLCPKDYGPIRYLMERGRLSSGTGTATGPRILDFLPMVGDDESPPGDSAVAARVGGFDGDALFSDSGLGDGQGAVVDGQE